MSDKHVRAWSAFLDTKADFIICFEDDAVFKENSISNIVELIGQLKGIDNHKPLYIDLAGGCDLKDIQINKLQEKQDKCFRYYKKPVTNTACVYLMNRSLVCEFHNIITRNPWIRLIGVDWMMNCLFINMSKNIKTSCYVICQHADPTIFKHGTTTGEYVSWQANAPH